MATKKLPRSKAGNKRALSEAHLEELQRFRSLLERAQHAVVRAPNREIPLKGYGPVAALQAYDTVQSVIEGIDDMLALGGVS